MIKNKKEFFLYLSVFLCTWANPRNEIITGKQNFGRYAKIFENFGDTSWAASLKQNYSHDMNYVVAMLLNDKSN